MKKCAKCEKTVYPTEELKCLDKMWHKACFRCWECGMILNMKNYKGYDKKPYCNAHYPTTKFTAVAETPEMARITANTKLQSQASYTSDFEKTIRGQYTAISDDLENRRLMENAKNFSLLNYHNDFEKSKGKYTTIADDPELIRQLKNQNNYSLVKYHEEFEKMKGLKTSVVDDPELLRLKQNTRISSNIEYQGLRNKHADMEGRRNLIDQGDIPFSAVGSGMRPPQRDDYDYQQPQHTGVQRRPPGSISDYNAEDEHRPSPYSGRNTGSSVMYNQSGRADPSYPRAANGGPPRGPVPMIPLGQPMSVLVRSPEEPEAPKQYYPPEEKRYPIPAPPHQPAPPPAHVNLAYRAMYDYTAADSDEVSFIEGDLIINPDPIDDGWMYGTVERTAKTGMLPANYVERA